MSSVLDAVTLTASDLRSSLGFYDAALAALGWERLAELVDEEEDDAAVEAVGWGPAGSEPQLWVVAGGPEPTRGVHVRLRAASREAVTAFWTAGLAAGGTAHAAPRRWAIYRRGEFGASLADPDGNLLEVVSGE